MSHSPRRLSQADITTITNAVATRMKSDNEESSIVGTLHPLTDKNSWLHDKHKRNRVLLVAAMAGIAFILEEHFKLSWGHRLAEIGTDCIADFLLFGSLE